MCVHGEQTIAIVSPKKNLKSIQTLQYLYALNPGGSHIMCIFYVVRDLVVTLYPCMCSDLQHQADVAEKQRELEALRSRVEELTRRKRELEQRLRHLPTDSLKARLLENVRVGGKELVVTTMCVSKSLPFCFIC